MTEVCGYQVAVCATVNGTQLLSISVAEYGWTAPIHKTSYANDSSLKHSIACLLPHSCYLWQAPLKIGIIWQGWILHCGNWHVLVYDNTITPKIGNVKILFKTILTKRSQLLQIWLLENIFTSLPYSTWKLPKRVDLHDLSFEAARHVCIFRNCKNTET